jgi:ArsR family transcriptional regulator
LSSKLAAPTKPVRRKAAPAKSGISLSDDTIDQLKEMFKALADASRLKILMVLSEHGEMHVNGICELLGQSQPAVSHHLTLLRMNHLVSFRREGKNNYYSVDASQLRGLLEQFFSETGNGHKLFQFPGFSLTYRSKK